MQRVEGDFLRRNHHCVCGTLSGGRKRNLIHIDTVSAISVQKTWETLRRKGEGPCFNP